ncbi:hypothetical protein [Yinghuangia seranimata]|uniref:hypothetical protein n=1 Tax=Yinghuangia seranimata TaxID=408067 RepID=UPI00248AC1E3|nr:hypothetical protein [Yinghuangia seranimata]MDI2131606.1 hypothetical protein [Yinghuangia seranimata]
MKEVPRPRTESALPASSPFDCWVGVPKPLRKHHELVGAERAFALADWVEDVGAMNLASELLRTRDVLAEVLRLLRQRGVDPVAEFERMRMAAEQPADGDAEGESEGGVVAVPEEAPPPRVPVQGSGEATRVAGSD